MRAPRDELLPIRPTRLLDTVPQFDFRLTRRGLPLPAASPGQDRRRPSGHGGTHRALAATVTYQRPFPRFLRELDILELDTVWEPTRTMRNRPRLPGLDQRHVSYSHRDRGGLPGHINHSHYPFLLPDDQRERISWLKHGVMTYTKITVAGWCHSPQRRFHKLWTRPVQMVQSQIRTITHPMGNWRCPPPGVL